MSEYLEEVNKYLNDDSFNNICNNYKRIIGIESDLDIINENRKCVGRIILMNNVSKKLTLNLIVEFRKDKIKWKDYKNGTESGFYLIDPYWVRSYSPDPKIEVPINVYRPKTNTIETEITKLTYKQFQQSRLMEFYIREKWSHQWVAAYENFRNVYASSCQKYLAINSTVKHYKIPQPTLETILSLVDNKKKQIKNEWGRYLNHQIQQDQSILKIEKLFSKNKAEKKSKNVVKFKKSG